MDPVSATIELEGKLTAWRQRVTPDAVTVRIAEGLKPVVDHFTINGVMTAPKAVLNDTERQIRAKDDEETRRLAGELQEELAVTEHALAETIDVAASLPHPLDLATGTTTERELYRLRVQLELDGLERKWHGRPAAALVDAYERAHPERDRTLIWFTESEMAAGWPNVQLQHGPEDATAMLRLKELIAARRHARVEKEFPQLLEAQKRLKAAMPVAVREMLRHFVQERRGLALVR